jgi:hypothetical protein
MANFDWFSAIFETTGKVELVEIGDGHVGNVTEEDDNVDDEELKALLAWARARALMASNDDMMEGFSYEARPTITPSTCPIIERMSSLSFLSQQTNNPHQMKLKSHKHIKRSLGNVRCFESTIDRDV